MRPSRILLILIIVLFGVVSLRIAAIWTGSERMLKPDYYEYPRPAEADPHKLGLRYEDVAFPTAAGATLRGWFVPGSRDVNGGVIAVHGAGSNRGGLLPLLPFLNEAGYHVLLFDLRDHGTSDGLGRGLGFGYREMHDVSAAVTYMKTKRRLRRVIVLGVSMGAASAILAAAGDTRIDGVIADASWGHIEDVMLQSPDRRWFVSDRLIAAIRDFTFLRLGALGDPEPLDVIGRIALRPILLIQGTDDALVPPGEAERLFAAAGEPKELWIVEGGRHGQLFASHPEEYKRHVIAFLSRWLAPAKKNPSAVSSSK
jgi:alpha-beta hydrolase superfamily lysophospholipase